MFGALTEKFQKIFSKLVGEKKITEENIQEAVSEVRLALLDADVQYAVVKNFIKKVKEKALGVELLKSVQPGQQFIKIVHDELASLMGSDEEGIKIQKRPSKIVLCGLQGSGKTTQAVKLAAYLQNNGQYKRPCVIACDLARPAAVLQLRTLSEQAQIDCFYNENEKNPVRIAKAALDAQKEKGWDLLIFDTAGRLHVDEVLMAELKTVVATVQPDEILFVANAATGQDAVKTAEHFNRELSISGSILTMLDGTSRAGAALSIREVTQKPLKFEGVGERISDLRIFNPHSMADRILGMGDTINLVKKAQEHFKEEEAKELEKKMRNAEFTYEDFLKQLAMVRKMGSIKSLLGMLPGMSKLSEMDIDEKEFFKSEAIIFSMTPDERRELCELTISRKKRIAKGSGTTLDDVNKLHKMFKQAKMFMKNLPNKKQLEKLFGGSSLWR